MDQFREWRQGEDEPTYFYFDFWCDGDGEPDVAAYTGEIFIPGMGDCGTGGCYVREVPGPLVFKCALSVDHALQLFGAAFTTLAGREIFRVAQKRLPSWLTMRDLIAMATDAAKADGLLRSQNQEVCVLLDGYAGATLFVHRRYCGASSYRVWGSCNAARSGQSGRRNAAVLF